MKYTPKKIISLLLVFVTLFLSACSQSDVNSDTEAETQATAESVESADSESVVEEEPDDLAGVIKALPDADYDGYDFSQWMSDNQLTTTIFMRQGPEEEMTGEAINDALWTRDRAMEEKYKIKMTYNATGSVNGDAQKVVASGQDEIGLLYLTMITAQPFVTGGNAVDMSTVSGIDLTQEYWSQNATNDLAIDGHVFYATGDVTTRYAGAPYIILFNKKLLTERSFDEPYDLVKEGTWTFDKLYGMVEGQYQDADGSGTNNDKDFFGFAYEKGMQGFAFYNGFGYNAVRFEGTETVMKIKDEEQINSLDVLTAFAALPDVRVEGVTYAETAIFEEDRALFVGQTACNLFMLTDMETDFGVLPVPKQNEAQDNYYSYCNLNCATSVHIPKSSMDLERTGLLVNSLAAASRVSSMRAQYEVTLQLRQTRDEESVEMIQIASEAATYDPCNLYNLGGLYGMINTCIDSGTSIASKIKSVEKLVSKTAERMIEKLITVE